MVTTDPHKEKRCVKEIFNVLNEWVEKLYPDLKVDEILPKKQEPEFDENKRQKVDEEGKEIIKEKTIEDEIRDEVQGLRKQRIFFVFETGTQGVVFIKLLDELKPYIDVKKIGMAIINNVAETKESSTRFTFRFVPIDLLCKAGNLENFKTLAGPIIKKYFQEKPIEGKEIANEESKVEPMTWSLEFKSKNNKSMKKQEFLDYLFSEIDSKTHPVDLKDSEYNVIIEIFKDLLMFTVVSKYKELKKFNLSQLVMNEVEEERRCVKISELNFNKP